MSTITSLIASRSNIREIASDDVLPAATEFEAVANQLAGTTASDAAAVKLAAEVWAIMPDNQCIPEIEAARNAARVILHEFSRSNGIDLVPFRPRWVDELYPYDDEGAIVRRWQLADSVIAAIPETTRPSVMPTHSEDFTSVDWFGTPYQFKKGLQSESVRCLWEAWEQGTPNLSEQTIRENAGSANDRFRLSHVFKPTSMTTRKREAHPAWGTMIKSTSKGVFALSPP